MIALAGHSERTFTFPAPLEETVTFYTDFARQLALLPHISLVRRYGPNSYRVMYHSVELGAYDVRLYCDVRARYDARRRCLAVSPLPGREPVPARVTLRSLVAHGQYTSRSVFAAAGPETHVTFEMTLRAVLPTPLAVSLVPTAILERAALGIANWRIQAIASGFVDRSAAAYWASMANGTTQVSGRRARNG